MTSRANQYLFILVSLFLGLSILMNYGDSRIETEILNGQRKIIITDEHLKLEDPLNAYQTLHQLNEEDVVLSYSLSNGYYVLSYEQGDYQIQIEKSIISSISTDNENWRIYITYSNDLKQEINYFGDQVIKPKPIIQPNPYHFFPLTAYIFVEFPIPGKVDLTIKRRDERGIDLTKSFSNFTSHHRIPVLGLYEDYTNQVIINFNSKDGKHRFAIPLEIKTDPINRTEHEFSFEIKKELTAPKFKGIFLFWERYITDTLGYLRWYHNYKRRIVIQYSFPLAEGRVCLLNPAGSLIRIHSYIGEILHQFTNTKLVTHDVTEKSIGGNLLMITMWTNRPYITDDGIIEYDPKTDTMVREIDTKDIFDEHRPIKETKFFDPSHTWIHLNSVTYIPEDNTLLVSSRNQNFIAKLGYDDLDIKWIAGFHANWTEKYQKYLLNPTNFDTSHHVDQDWPLWPHNPIMLPNGNLMVIDDGGARPGFENFPDPETEIKRILKNVSYLKLHYPNGVDPGYIRAVEYKIDTEKMTISKEFEYTDFPTLPASILGSVQMLDDDVILIGYGEFEFMTMLNKTSMEILWQAASSYEYYRVTPVDLYGHYH